MSEHGADGRNLLPVELRNRGVGLRRDANVRRSRLAALRMIASGVNVSEVAGRVGVSTRTVRRWLSRYRLYGTHALERQKGIGRPNRLTSNQTRRLRADLKRPPAALGYEGRHWSGALLARHLRDRYGVTLGARRCRQLLGAFEVLRQKPALTVRNLQTGPRPAACKAASPRPVARGPLPPTPERLIRQVKRLASSGLPLEPFVRALFDLIGSAIPLAQCKILLGDPRPPFTGYVANDPAVRELAAATRHYCIDAPPTVSGTIDINSPHLRVKPVWMHEEIALPHYYESAGYNEVMRHLDFHHCMIAMLMEGGRFAGRWPLWRSTRMKPWSREEARLMAALTPHIAHGLEAARLLSPRPCGAEEEFVPIDDSPQGTILLDHHGNVQGMDAAARNLFFEIGLFEAPPIGPFAGEDLREALSYIATTLRQAFDGDGERSLTSGVPAARIYSHWSGIVARLRSIALDGDAGRHLVVLLERGELAAHRETRLRVRYGLTRRELQMLRLLAGNRRPSEVTASMGITPGTFKTYCARLKDKLGLNAIGEVRSFAARELRRSEQID